MAFSETVRRTIALAKAAREAWARVSRPGAPIMPSGFIGNGGTATIEVPPAAAALRDYLDSLSADEVFGLTTMMYLGRHDFPASEFRDRLKFVRMSFFEPQWAISQMVGKVSLAEFLEEGLARMGPDNADALIP